MLVNSCFLLTFFSLDNILTVAVDRKTIISYDEDEPLPINYIGFSSNGEARFHFDCESKQSNDVSHFN